MAHLYQRNRKGKSISDAALLKQLKQTHPTLTVHGFRSSFRDWSGEVSSFPRDVAEMALAHAIKDKVEAAYRRGDLFEKRRLMMQAWSGFLNSQNNDQKVVPIR